MCQDILQKHKKVEKKMQSDNRLEQKILDAQCSEHMFKHMLTI